MDTISGSGLTPFKSNHCHGNNNINPARAPLCRRYRLNRIKGQKCQIAFHVCVCVCVCVCVVKEGLAWFFCMRYFSELLDAWRNVSCLAPRWQCNCHGHHWSDGICGYWYSFWLGYHSSCEITSGRGCGVRHINCSFRSCCWSNKRWWWHCRGWYCGNGTKLSG